MSNNGTKLSNSGTGKGIELVSIPEYLVKNKT
jgi:hypothetical protein